MFPPRKKIGILIIIIFLLSIFSWNIEISFAGTFSGGSAWSPISSPPTSSYTPPTTSSTPPSSPSTASSVSTTSASTYTAPPPPLSVNVINPYLRVRSDEDEPLETNSNVTGNVGVYNHNNIPLNTNLTMAFPGTTFTRDELYMNNYSADIWFTVVLVWLFAIANFLMTVILLLRIVILWILLILSPFLLILALFVFSRSLFKTWAWVYLRWIVIGPILAMGLGIVVYIWQLTGVPVQSLAKSTEILPAGVTNLSFAVPFQNTGKGAYSYEIMQIVIVILMLYAVIFLPFWLTKKSNFLTASVNNFAKKSNKQTSFYQPNQNYTEKAEEETKNNLNKVLDDSKTGNLIESFKKSYAGEKAKKSLDKLFQNMDKNKTDETIGSIFTKKQTAIIDGKKWKEELPENKENKPEIGQNQPLQKDFMENGKTLEKENQKNEWIQNEPNIQNTKESTDILGLGQAPLEGNATETFERERKSANLVEQQPLTQNSPQTMGSSSKIDLNSQTQKNPLIQTTTKINEIKNQSETATEKVENIQKTVNSNENIATKTEIQETEKSVKNSQTIANVWNVAKTEKIENLKTIDPDTKASTTKF